MTLASLRSLVSLASFVLCPFFIKFIWLGFMSSLFCVAVHTANLLGIFTDPFEFAGDYGSEVNPIREQVFELVVSKEALSKNLSGAEIKKLMQDEDATEEQVISYRRALVVEAINQEKLYGPTLGELVTPDLIEALEQKQRELQIAEFTDLDLTNIIHFINHYKDEKVFRFLRNNPSELLNLDVTLRTNASRNGVAFELPILGSTMPLEVSNTFQLKKNLLDSLFIEETFACTKPQKMIQETIDQLPENFLRSFLNANADNQDLQVFASPAGQVFFYWMYQALNLHLTSANIKMIEQINKVKDVFVHTIGDPIVKGCSLRDHLIDANSAVLFTQESDALLPQILTDNQLFLPVDGQNPKDGTFVFLRNGTWQPDYEVISISNYERFDKGCMNVVLARRMDSGQKFLLASCHGRSTDFTDACLQISLIMEKFDQLYDGSMQLLIGIDANTKTEKEVEAFRNHLDHLGLVATRVGPTTVKRRMVSTQHGKVGRLAIDEEDYLITLKSSNGAHFILGGLSVGFKYSFPDRNSIQLLPNIENPSDHYPVGAIMAPTRNYYP